MGPGRGFVVFAHQVAHALAPDTLAMDRDEHGHLPVTRQHSLCAARHVVVQSRDRRLAQESQPFATPFPHTQDASVPSYVK